MIFYRRLEIQNTFGLEKPYFLLRLGFNFSLLKFNQILIFRTYIHLFVRVKNLLVYQKLERKNYSSHSKLSGR